MTDLLQLSYGSDETTQVGLHVNSAFSCSLKLCWTSETEV